MPEDIIIFKGLIDPQGRKLNWSENNPIFPRDEQSGLNGEAQYIVDALVKTGEKLYPIESHHWV